MIKKFFITIACLVVFAFPSAAQQQIEMADTFRADGKIYVVVGILSIVFAGIVLFLIRLERKVSRLEKDQMSS
ncbi:MAG: CcmD family protein [Bacteroidia bacterium]